MTIGDDTLAAEMIGLLREIKGQQDTQATKAASLERAMLALNQSVTAIDDRRVSALVVALWGLSGAIVTAGALIAAAITWGIR
jgi:hypothetical protein